MNIQFTKMHGLGNDFVVIDAINQSIDLSSEQIRFIANRHFGVGCDQLLLVEPTVRSDVDFQYRIFNADGGEVEQCGNGARCFARFVLEEGLTDKQTISVSTNAGKIILKVLEDSQVQVNMGVPQLQPDKIPFKSETQENSYRVVVSNIKPIQELELSVVSIGNPHAVLIVDDVKTARVESIGAAIENHSHFPNRVNVGFMQIVDNKHIYLRVFERGVGETKACGTGACAAVVSGQLRGLLSEKVSVSLLGGKLDIQWSGIGTPVLMTGPAETVFKGYMTL